MLKVHYVDLLCICYTTCCAANPQQIELTKLDLYKTFELVVEVFLEIICQRF